MKSFHCSKYNLVGFDDKEGMYRFESKHDSKLQREVVLVFEAKYINEDGSVTVCSQGNSDLLSRLQAYSKINVKK